MSNPEGDSFSGDEESPTGKLARKSKEFPFMPIGLTGAVMGCLYGAYKYRYRGEMSTSIFLIHLRLAAQGAVVSALTIGIAYSLVRDLMHPPTHEDHTPSGPVYHPKPHPRGEPVSPHYEPRKEK